MITIEQIRRARAKGKGQLTQYQKNPATSTLAGQAIHMFQFPGIPAAGSYGGARAPVQFVGNKAAPSHASGLILFDNGVAPEDLFLSLVRLINPSTNCQGILHIVDLLVEYGGFSGTSAVLQSTAVATGVNNLPRYTNGEGVIAFIEAQTNLGATPANVTLVYTDQDGNTGTAPLQTTIASIAAGKAVQLNGPFWGMAAGDRGIKSVQSLTLSASTLAGTIAVLLCKPLASIVCPLTLGVMEGDFSNLAPMLPPLNDDVALGFIWQPTTTNTPVLSGVVEGLALNADDPDA